MNRTVQAWVMVALLIILMLINFLDKVVLGMVAPPLISELGLTPTEFGFLAGSFFWLFALSGIVVGLVADRMSPKKLLLWMALAWALLQLPIYFSSSLGVFVLCRVLLGAGEGPAWAISVHAVYNWFPNERRALPVSILAQGAMAGLLLAGVIIPPITIAFGWRTNFLVLGIAGLVWAGLWLIIGKDGPDEARRHGAQAGSAGPDSAQKPARVESKPGNTPTETPTESKPITGRVPYRYLLLNRTVLSVIALHFAFYWSFALLLTWLPSYLHDGLKFSPLTAGRFFSFFVLLNIPVNIVLCGYAQRLSRRGFTSRIARGVFMSTLFLISGMLLFVPWLSEVTAVVKVVALAIAFGAITTVVSLGPAILSEVSPPTQRAGLIAIDTAIASIAGIIAPLIMGGCHRGNDGQTGIGQRLRDRFRAGRGAASHRRAGGAVLPRPGENRP